MEPANNRMPMSYWYHLMQNRGSWFSLWWNQGAQESVQGIDPNLLALFQVGVLADGSYIALVSGVVSGGVTGPNQLVNFINAKLCHYVRLHFGGCKVLAIGEHQVKMFLVNLMGPAVSATFWRLNFGQLPRNRALFHGNLRGAHPPNFSPPSPGNCRRPYL